VGRPARRFRPPALERFEECERAVV
jgi:hypothetical protein